jgi:hypothetical protein
MWADWLKVYIPRAALEHRISSTLAHIEGDETSYHRRTGDPHSRRIKCVCRTCNNGWMSALQEDAKPILIPLLKGTNTTLHRRAQTTLASWIAMTVMVAEHVDKDKIAIGTDERSWFRNNRRAPGHWRIWIGRHSRDRRGMVTHNVMSFVSKEEFERAPHRPTGEANTQTTTICLGEHLLVHVMSSLVAYDIIRMWKLPPMVAPYLAQIWPVRIGLVRWPPPLALTDAGISLLSNEFFNRATWLARRHSS